MNKKIKIAALSTVFSLCCMMFFSCSSSGNATVNISLNLPKNVSVLKSGPDTIIDRVLRLFSTAAMAAPEDVTSIAVQVSGPGMDTFERTYPADTVQVTLAVESGADRKFVVKAYKADGLVWYAGTATVDLASGETRVVVITMRDTLRMVADIYADTVSSSPDNMIAYNGKLYFTADDGTHGDELWVYDPATEDCQMVYDINSGSQGSSPENMLVFNGKLYFTATDGYMLLDRSYSGTELWVYDGTNDPVIVYDINTQPDSGYAGNMSSDPMYLTIHNNKLYFRAYDGVNGIELWEYDGKAVPAVYDVNITMYDINTMSGVGSSPGFLTSFDGRLFFQATGTDTSGAEVYYLEGDTTSMLYNIYMGESGSSYPSNFTVFDGSLYFTATDYIYTPTPPDGITNHGYELWRYDGDTDPTLLTDINSQVVTAGQNYGSSPEELTIMGDNLYFRANDGISGSELWSYNGNYPATLGADIQQLTDIYPEIGNSYTESLTPINGLLYFGATTNGNDTYLYTFDPKSFAATQVFMMQNNLDDLQQLGNVLAYCDTNGEAASSVWVYDPAKPVVEGVNPYDMSTFNDSISYAKILMVQGNRVYISADDETRGQELWIYDFYK